MTDFELDSIFVYEIKLPDGIHEYVTPCADGYTVYLNRNLTREMQEKAFVHALLHIKNRDFEKPDVQAIEAEAHS